MPRYGTQNSLRIQKDGVTDRVGSHAVPVEVQPTGTRPLRHLEANDQPAALGVVNDAPGEGVACLQGSIREAVGAGLPVVTVVQAKHAAGVCRVVGEAGPCRCVPCWTHTAISVGTLRASV